MQSTTQLQGMSWRTGSTRIGDRLRGKCEATARTCCRMLAPRLRIRRDDRLAKGKSSPLVGPLRRVIDTAKQIYCAADCSLEEPANGSRTGPSGRNQQASEWGEYHCVQRSRSRCCRPRMVGVRVLRRKEKRGEGSGRCRIWHNNRLRSVVRERKTFLAYLPQANDGWALLG